MVHPALPPRHAHQPGQRHDRRGGFLPRDPALAGRAAGAEADLRVRHHAAGRDARGPARGRPPRHPRRLAAAWYFQRRSYQVRARRVSW